MEDFQQEYSFDSEESSENIKEIKEAYHKGLNIFFILTK